MNAAEVLQLCRMVKAFCPSQQFDQEWRAVPGFPDYIISEGGAVISTRPGRRGNRKPVLLKPSLCRKGYPMVVLRDHTGRPRPKKVHWLVAEAFIGPRPAGLQIRHLDSDKTNCSASNLAYGTQIENMADRAIKTHCVNGHPFAEHGRPRKGGGRVCMVCQREADARRSPRVRSAA